ncbi:hypothetical protein SY27_09515 [Flavobacterium sp. 316]|uniref:C40 family peptidase n=1 Tax=Flavobacterium sp. 316 TaxID=1603293 RepID=UPI0005E2FEA7|nr:C40 family peptidase [Flavobacterium sp. 316]KIX21006.1 hypothetical protein SY27_09515 [Flavobacterium sp. 316]
MKKILVFIVLISIVSCKTQSNIITSKKEAKEKGIYSYSEDGRTKTVKSNRTKSSEKRENEEIVDKDDKGRKLEKKATNSLANKIINDALDNLGVKYRTGGTTKTGMDCSGLVFSTYGNYDISLPRTSIDMSRHGQKIKKNEAQPGDLIFFKTNGRSVINHVGIITEIVNDEIKFIHSSTKRGVIVSSTLDAYYSKTFAQINRVLD